MMTIMDAVRDRAAQAKIQVKTYRFPIAIAVCYDTEKFSEFELVKQRKLLQELKAHYFMSVEQLSNLIRTNRIGIRTSISLPLELIHAFAKYQVKG